MSWADIKTLARAEVHENFGLSAQYLAPNGGPRITGITVRWHTKVLRHGDLDREGYPQVMEDVNRIILDSRAVPEPERNGIVSLADGRAYSIDYVLPYEGRFIPCDVVRVSA
jgi:hypothetical protein